MTSFRNDDKNLIIRNLVEETARSTFDPKVNIKIAPLVGDSTMTLYSTILGPQSSVTAHAHKEGIELYYILDGEGEICSGRLVDGDDVEWEEPKKVKSGDAFAINPGVVHQLKNTSTSKDLTLIFVCPHSHLKDDRVITKTYF